MSDRYPGGFITKNTPVTTQSSAPGVWTLDQAMQATKAGNWPVNGPFFIEDVFSTYLYTGNGSTQTITNGIDLSTKGGLVWIKSRSSTATHYLFDTNRGATKFLLSELTAAENTAANSLTSFNSNGFSLGAATAVNGSGLSLASWTFRKQPKFFDVVTYTGTGSNTTIAHNLGSVPGCIIVKRTDATADWQVYHRANTVLPATDYLVLNSTAATVDSNTRWNDTLPTDTVFSLGTDATVNASGGTYVAYLFAHNAGGFGLTGTDNVISCGSYTGNGSTTGPIINLGYEPQWLLVKRTNVSGNNWIIVDNMRGFPETGLVAELWPNLSDAEVTVTSPQVKPTSTGFQVVATGTNFNGSGSTYIYIAIRRGPMKVPTTGTSVFGLNARTGTGANATVTGSAGVSDAVLVKNRGSAVASLFSSRLTSTGYLVTSSSAVEVAAGTTILQANAWDVMDGVKVGTTSTITNASANTYINYLFKRAPNFMDVVCFTGTGATGQAINHNLGVAPEFYVVKSRSTVIADGWQTYWSVVPNPLNIYLPLNSSNARDTNTDAWQTPTSTQIKIGAGLAGYMNASGQTYVAYLFATCAGVSKVGSYTGNGTTQTIDCGFTGGARFVLIKRTDSTGDWYVWDSARGIVAGNDPYLLLNSTAAEVTSTDYIDTASAGFEISSTAPAAINASSGTFIFLAIA